jgi:LEA14-like dessication related protein
MRPNEGKIAENAVCADNWSMRLCVPARFPSQSFFVIVSVLLSLCFSCASPAPAESAPALPRPQASLSFDRVEAEGPGRLLLRFNLEAENPRGGDARITASVRRAVFNGKTDVPGITFTASREFASQGLALQGPAPQGFVAGGGKTALPLCLELDTETCLRDAAGGGCETELGVDVLFDFGGGDTETIPVKALAAFPLILEPEFRIVSVTVKKAELIDTRFNVKALLVNPNFFPVELSAFSFELYNGASLWADGGKRNVMVIPQGQSAETDLLLTMNFAGMRRGLLDQVIAMEQIDYRFTGEATVSTGIEYLPQFRWKFDQSGRSAVTD